MNPQTEPETPLFQSPKSLKSFDDGHAEAAGNLSGTPNSVFGELTARLHPTKTERYEFQFSNFRKWLTDNAIKAVSTNPWDIKLRENVAYCQRQYFLDTE
ncbi:MAG: hypothetical protein H6887_03860 [Hoeflea sp.]|nr:hypothetical protein [Hoeflea sp.]